MADVLRTLVVLLLCALCLGSCAREGDKGEGDKGYRLQVTGYEDKGYGVQVKPLPAEAGFPVSGDTSGLQVTGYGDKGEEEAETVNGSGLTVKDSEAQQAVKNDKSDEQESSTVSRSMQESTETVAKTYGYFSENGGSEKNQNRSSVSGVSATKEDPQPSDINHQPSDLSHQPSDIAHHTSDITPQPSDITPQPSDTLAAGAVSADPEEPKAEVILPPVLIDNHPGTEENVAESASSQPSDINPQPSDIAPQPSDSTQQNSEPKPVVALRTNLLYDAMLVPNIGVEVGLGKGFTLAADWFGTWLFSDKNHWYWQGYGGYLTARYYFDKDNPQYSLTPGQMLSSGHHVGIYGTALTYDVEFGGIGYQAAQFGFGGGVEYGYSLKVAQSLCIDFNLGLGYQGGEYKKYMPTDDGSGHYVWMSTHRRHWWGPTKAEISLKWLITPTKKKGGER
jgi:hypothetical protein